MRDLNPNTALAPHPSPRKIAATLRPKNSALIVFQP